MLKHVVDKHEGEDKSKIQFWIRVIKYSKSSYERQINESLMIQANRNHHLLNSRSEYNRCAVRRLACKLGDREFKLFEKEVEKDIKKEESQVSKIRTLVKERNKTRYRGRGPPHKEKKTRLDTRN